MRVIEKYGSLVEHTLSNQNIIKYGSMLVKYGLKGTATKVHPAVLCIDAAISVLEAGASYLKYAQQTEITQQIFMENERIKQELMFQFKIKKEQFESSWQNNNNRLEVLKAHVSSLEHANNNLDEEVDALFEIAKKMHHDIRLQREQAINFKEIILLQNNLDRLIRSCLEYTLQKITKD